MREGSGLALPMPGYRSGNFKGRTMEEIQFKEGDTVYLASDGPVMTVERVNSDGSVVCVWFDAKVNYKRQSFQLGMLRRYTPPEGEID